MVMTSKEKAEASNALLCWFDSQDINSSDALDIMTVLIAVEISALVPEARRQEKMTWFMKALNG